MLEIVLMHGVAPIYAWIVSGMFFLAGVAWGVARALGFYACFLIAGWPNGSDHRPLTHAFTSILFILISPSMIPGSWLGFYAIFYAYELLGARIAPMAKFVAYCDRVAHESHGTPDKPGKPILSWLWFVI